MERQTFISGITFALLVAPLAAETQRAEARPDGQSRDRTLS